MADTDNKGNASSRTSLNPSDMEESVLPIDMLGPNSLRKKKLLNEKIFEEISYRAFLASIQVYLVTSQILQQTIRQKQEDQAESIHHREIEKSRLHDTQNMQQSADKSRNVNSHHTRESLNSLFDQVSTALEKIKQKIAEITVMLESKKREIERLEESLKVARRDLSEEFSKIFIEKVSPASFQPMQLFLSLPKEFKAKRGSERYQNAFKLNHESYEQLINEIADRINSGSIEPSSIESAVKKSVSDHVEKLITKNLGFLNENERAEALSSMMKSSAVESFIESISKNIVDTSMTDSIFREKMTEILYVENNCIQYKAHLQECEQQSLHMQQLMGEGTGMMDYLASRINQPSDLSVQDMGSTDLLNLTQSTEALLANLEQELAKPLTFPGDAILNLQTETLSQLDALLINAEKLDALGELPAKRDELMASISAIEDKFDASATTKMAELYSNKNKQQPGAGQAVAKEEVVEETESFRPRLR